MATNYLETQALEAEQTIDQHNERRGWEIDSPHHALVMFLVDALALADARGIDFDLAVEDARQTLADITQ